MRCSQHYLTFPLYIPSVIRLFRNWPLYLLNYIGRRERPAEYQLRNGVRLIDATGTLAGTIAVVFLRREYGTLKNLRTIVDIGANMGAFSIYAAYSCPNSQIYSYEPEEQNYRFLRQNIEVNSFEKRISTFKYAVAAFNGDRNIGLSQSPVHSFFSSQTDGPHQIVSCMTLGKIFETQCLSTIDLLKINCEGAEYEILESCEPVYYEQIRNIRLEYHNLDSHKRNGEYLSKFLESKGYVIERFSRYKGISGFIWASRKK